MYLEKRMRGEYKMIVRGNKKYRGGVDKVGEESGVGNRWLRVFGV
jgi:hypothetical protein